MNHGDFPIPDLSGVNLKKRPSLIQTSTKETLQEVAKVTAATVNNEEPARILTAPAIPAPPVTDEVVSKVVSGPAPQTEAKDKKTAEPKKSDTPVVEEKRGRGRPRKSTSSSVDGVDGDIKGSGSGYGQVVSFRMPDETVEMLDRFGKQFGMKRIGVVTMMINIMTMLEHIDCDLNAISDSYSSVLKLRKVLGLDSDELLKSKLKTILLNEMNGVSE